MKSLKVLHYLFFLSCFFYTFSNIEAQCVLGSCTVGGVNQGTIHTSGTSATNAPCSSGSVCLTRGGTTTPICDVAPAVIDVCQNTTYTISSVNSVVYGWPTGVNEVSGTYTITTNTTTDNAGQVCGAACDDVTSITVQFTQVGQALIDIGDCTFEFNVQASPIATAITGGGDICENADVVLTSSCTGGCTGATYNWVYSGGLVGTGTTTNTVPAANTTAGNTHTVDLTITNDKTDVTGAGCMDATPQISINIQGRPDGNLTYGNTSEGNPYSASGSPDREICINGSQEVTVNCTANCPTAAPGGYRWGIQKTNGPNYFAAGQGSWNQGAATAGTLTPSNTVILGPNTGWWGTGGSGTGGSVGPGDYNLRVQVTNDFGCFRNIDAVDAIRVNDLPAVEIIQTDYSFTSNPVCAGETISFRNNICNDADYILSAMSNPNTSVDPGSNFAPNVNIGVTSGTPDPIPYTSPCTSVDGNRNFKMLTWTATGEDGTPIPNVIARGTATNVAVDPDSEDDRTMDVVASMVGNTGGDITNTVTYTLEVVGNNGCTNTDQIIIDTKELEIDFENRTVNPRVTATGNPPRVTTCLGVVQEIRPYVYFNDGTTRTDFTSFVTNWTWSEPAGNVNSITTNTSDRNMETDPVQTNGSISTYNLSVVDQDGCIGSGTLEVEGVQGPNMSLSLGSACIGEPVDIIDASFQSGYSYDVFNVDPSSGNPTPIIAGNLTDTMTINNPVNGQTYWVTVSVGDCEQTKSIQVNLSPLPVWDSLSTFGLNYPTYENTCNDKAIKFVANASGGTGSLTYTWVATGITQSGAANQTTNPMGSYSATGGGGYFTWVFSGWFPVLVYVTNPPSENSYTFDANHPQQQWGNPTFGPNGAGLQVTVTDQNTCSISEEWRFDIIACGVPNMSKEKSTTLNGTYNLFDDFGCLNEFVRLTIDIPSSGPSPSYTPSYEWRQQNSNVILTNQASYTYRLTNNLPDTMFTVCTVFKPKDEADPNGDKEIVSVLFDTTIISRGFVDMYPYGDNDPAVIDSTICLNEYVNAQANCRPCKGSVEYIWAGNASGNSYVTGNTYDSYSFQGNTAASTFNIDLEVQHGEDCVDNYSRQVYVNENPEVYLLRNGQRVTTPIHLCDGDIETLTVDVASCSTCGSASYVWNTTATSVSINVASQGGYYAEVRDANTCLGATNIAIVIDAHEGLNSAVMANPSQVCSGENVQLEVAPCIGCSYVWHNANPPATNQVAITRTHSTNVGGIYYAEVENYFGCVYPTSTINVTTTTLSIPSITGTTDSVCRGEYTTLSTTPISGGAYQWYLDGRIISGATNSTYTTSDSGSYFVAVTYPNGCISESPLFNVYDVSFKPNISAISTVVCRNSNADLLTDLQSGWRYQWYNDGLPISGANASIYSARTSGSHYVEVETGYGCIERSDSINITTSLLTTPNANTSTPSICPGESGLLAVSLCTGCSYQWFSATTGLAITNDSTSNYRDSVYTTGSYYAIVSEGGCSEFSDTVSITVNSVFTPAINTTSSVVCNGRDALLFTPRCIGCTYRWLVDSLPVLGALNDTFYLVDNVVDTGNYQIAIDYANGCSDTSSILKIEDGSYDVLLEISPSGLIDSVICNGVGETLLATPNQNLTGIYSHTLFLNNTPVTGFSNITSGSAFNTFPGNNPGVYTVEVTNPLGCKVISNLLPLRAVNIAPTLSARATSNLSSVATSAICTPTGTAYLEVDVVPSCPTCTYEWRRNSSIIISNGTIKNYTTNLGSAGAGLYTVRVTDDGCTELSAPLDIRNEIGTLDSEANTTDTSICNGQSVTLEHADRVNCVGCSYRWLRTSNPINGASNYQYITSTPGLYNLEVTTSSGCVDTSSFINVREVNPPSGLMLDFDSLVLAPSVLATGTPLASNGSAIDMNNWVFPPYARHSTTNTAFTSYFTSSPFNGALFANAGLQGVDSIIFQPDDSLAGFHLITYYYDTLGCTFTVDDVLEVLPPAAISVTNLNPASVAYEACVGDALVINTVNLDFAIDEVFAFDTDDNYQLIPLNSFASTSDTFGVNVRWNTTINLNVPGDAYASYFMLVGNNLVTGTRDTTFTSFVLIHNTDLSFTGLPNMLCSNGEGSTLFGSPTGGSFYAEAAASGARIAGAFVGDTLYPQQLTQGAYVNGSQFIDVYYSYTETYTNGNLCPSDDTVSIRKEVKDVRLTDVQFNTISVSQTKELLTNLVAQTTPYAARPNKQPLYTSSFRGSFTNPAGNPREFLPANAGVGRHALTYRIQSGSCINSVEDSITVVPAPRPISMPDTICRNYGTTPFARQISRFPYGPPVTSYPPNTAVASYTDEQNIISVTGTGVVPVSTTVGNETYLYNPTLVTGNYDTLVIEYRFYRDEDTLDITGTPIDFDTLEYIVAQIIKPIYIEDVTPVNIIDTIVSPFYCQENTLHLLAGNPSSNAFGGGLFMLYGGTNQYQFGDTLFNSVINPYDVNHLENATTTYDLVYVLNGAACNNSDTMSVTIGRGLNPAFATANGLDEFCDTDPNVLITHNVLPPDTAIWSIGGVPQPSYVFGPGPLAPGIHVVELQQLYTYIQATDTFVCSASAIDTFTIHALPALTVTPNLDNQYCANDPIVDLVVGPTPGCPVYAAPGHVILDEKFNSGIPPSWNSTYNFGGKNWTGATSLPQGGTGGAAFMDTSQVLNDSWLVTKTIDLVAGHRYRLTYMVRAGALDPTCSGFCDASLVVAIGQTSNPASMGTQLDFQPAISNDQTYVRYVVEHYHDPLAGFVTGTYNLGFRSVTPAFGRSLRLDNVRMRDMTLDNCSLAGIGYMNGPGVHNVADSLYQFNPLSVEAGSVEVKYIYTDVRGCQDSLVFPIKVDTAPIVSFTDLPLTYCENEPTLIITGSPLGGTFTSTMGTNLVPVGLAVLDTADFPVNYQTNTTGRDIVSYRFEDNNGCSEMVYDTIDVVRLLDSMFISSALDPFGNGHCVDADSTILNVTLFSGSPINNGVFYGAGVRNGAAGLGVAAFYPDSAEIDMGHTGDVTVEYIYTTTTGCADTTRFTTRVHALPNLSFMNLPDSLCLNADSFQLVAINQVVTGSMGQIMYADTLITAGQFTARDTNGLQLPNFIQLFDTLYPYTADGYSQVNVSYSYTASAAFGLCSSTIYDSVRIDTVPEVYFQDLRSYYCENEPTSMFSALPDFSIGSGYLLIDSTQIDSGFYWIDPSVMVGPGLTTAVYPTYYTYTDTRGCRGEVYDTFEVRPYPRITFDPTAQDTFCRQVGLYDLRQLLIAPIGGYFTDNLALTSIQDSFYLNLNSLAGPRLVTYHYTDPVTQCQNDSAIWLYLFNAPEIDFTVYGGCAQMDITFDGTANNLELGIDSITRIWWDFEGNGVLTNSHLDTSPITIPDTTYQYGTNGVYNVTLNVENQGSCPASITKSLIVSPYYDLTTDYFEDFNSGAGDWYDDQPISVTPSNVWTHENSLSGNFINNPDGFWVTMAANTLYQQNQSAWVYSPCFDFTDSRRPMIALDLWRDVLSGVDGAVLEFYNNTSNNWELVGNVGQGIDWYQSDFVLGRPGNQQNSTFPSGWTGRSNGAESARLRLDRFKGQRDIRFRIAFATSSQTVIDSTSGNGYEGVAFDNVWIGERTRNVLVEHFDHVDYVNTNSLTSSVINQSVYNKIFNSTNGLDVLLIQYQVDAQGLGTDPIFSTNPADLSSRQYEYSAEPNNIFVDGRTIGNGLSESLSQWDLDYDMLQFPDFDIQIDTPVTIVNGILSTNAVVTALKAKDSSITYTTRVAVIQDSLTYIGNSEMLSVFRKMLPNNGGIRKTGGWQQGEQQFVSQSLLLSSLGQQVPVNETQLEVIVFVQNANNLDRTVYQSATTQDLNRYNSIGTTQLEDDPATEIFDLNVYPNPSSDLFNVEFDKALEGEYNWRLVDVTGRVLQTGATTTGTEKFTIDAERLVDGAYFFIINSDDNRAYAQRKLIVIK